jgi:hypothetical protein
MGEGLANESAFAQAPKMGSSCGFVADAQFLKVLRSLKTR